MAHDPHPLPVPAENPTDNLVFLKRLDLATEQAADARERDVETTARAEGPLEYVADEVGSRDVEVGEVRAVGFVEVQVALVQGASGGGGDGGE